MRSDICKSDKNCSNMPVPRGFTEKNELKYTNLPNCLILSSKLKHKDINKTQIRHNNIENKIN